MTCPDCTASAAGPWHCFTASCPGCNARGVSRRPEFAESRRLGRLTPGYRQLLAVVGVAHSAAVAAYRLDAVNRKDGE